MSETGIMRIKQSNDFPKNLSLTKYFKIAVLIYCTTYGLCYWIQKQQPIVKHEQLKYILIWTKDYYPPYGTGRKGLVNCPVTECYITRDRNYFDGNPNRFDAIIFYGVNILPSDLPPFRSPNQKYIYVSLESPQYTASCNFKYYNDLFNWTATYRLDSDLPHPYMVIRDNKGDIVGPKQEMHWRTDMNSVDDEEFNKTINVKSKAVAWFVSNCFAKNKRELYAKELQKALEKYGHVLDVYGPCGTFECPKTQKPVCYLLLKTQYYFYLAMENSFDEDYVSEKVLTALQNDVVPIVYGGANYSRFLPPGSYIDARKRTVEQMAATINTLIHSPKQYKQYFRWKKYYIFEKTVHNECVICEALFNKTKFEETTTYNNFCRFWKPKYWRRSIMSNAVMQFTKYTS